MTDIYIDFKNINSHDADKKIISSIFKLKNDKTSFFAVLDLLNPGYDAFNSFPWDGMVTTYGTVISKADVFICFPSAETDYNALSGILINPKVKTIAIGAPHSKYCKFFDVILTDVSKLMTSHLTTTSNRSAPTMKRSKKKIAFITPYNLEKSAVARYSKCTLKYLCRKADVDVFSLQEEAENNVGANSMNYLTAYPYLSDKYDAVISVLGDSPFHNKMTQYHMMYGSHCIMNDSNLLWYFSSLFGTDYLVNLSKHYNHLSINTKELNSLITNSNMTEVTALEPILEAAQIFFTPSLKMYKKLIKKYKNIVYLPTCVYNDIDQSQITIEKRIRFKQKLGYKENDILIVSLGGVSGVKMSLEILQAFLQYASKNKSVKLAFVGGGLKYQPSLLKEFKSLIGTKNCVKIFEDFVSDELYNDYIYAADIAIQLRNTVGGQCSGALMDNISAGLYTISCEDLAEAIEAPSFIDRLPGIPSVKEITQAISHAVENKVYQKVYREERDEYLKIHNFDNYTDILLNNI